MIAIDNIGALQGNLEVVLQGLGQWLPYKDTARVPGGKVFYNVDAFSGTEDDWNQVPIVFIPEGVPVHHPPHDELARDPQGTAARMGYRIVGKLNNTQVRYTGDGTRMIADAILHDAHAAELAKNSLLGLSTGFDAQLRPDGRISGKIQPNHLLVFLKCGKTPAAHCGTQNDAMAAFNNTGDPAIAAIKQNIADMKAEQARQEAIFEAKSETQLFRASERRGVLNPLSGKFEGATPPGEQEHEGPSLPGAGISKDLSVMETVQARQRAVIMNRPLENGTYAPPALQEESRQREENALETNRARGKFDATTGRYRDFLPHELPE
jgi:hypothetical protein